MLMIHFIIGTIVGSFLCVVAERIPQGQSILFPPSHCPHCKNKLRSFELIPLVAILILKFRCRTCKHKLSLVYFVSEFVSGLLWVSLLVTPLEFTEYFLLLFSAFTLSLTDFFYLIVEPKIFFHVLFYYVFSKFFLKKHFTYFFVAF